MYVRYIVVVICTLVLGISLIEISVRLGTHNNSQGYLHRVFNEERVNIQIGDSHAGGNLSVLPDYAFIGKGGLTPTEIETVVKYYYQGRDKGRVIVVVGPNSLARNRQVESRSLPEGSLKSQILPVPLYLLEPAFRDGLRNRLFSIFDISANALDMTRKDALDLWAKTRRKEGRDFHIGMIGEQAEFLLAAGRFPNQNPVENFQTSIAFQAIERLMGWLKEQGIEACIVDTPISPMYQSIVADNSDTSRFEDAQKALQELAAQYGFKFASGPKLVPNFPTEMFQDQDHLSRKGHAIWWPMVEEFCFS